MMQSVEIFKSGRHTDMAGQCHTVSVADLTQIAQAYNPALHEAPLVIGHPKTHSPAYGWVEKLVVEGERLVAYPKQVNPQFAELVNGGAYKKRSASFYAPHSPGNPTPGQWHLRHVGFLGAKPPAIKGLRDVSFSEADECIEFADSYPSAFRTIAALFGRMRDFLISKEGLDSADQCLSSWDIDFLKRVADADTSQAAQFADATPLSEVSPHSTGDDMSEAIQAQLAAETAKTARLETELAALKAQQAQTEAAVRQRASADFAEGLIKAGKLAPVHQQTVVDLLVAAPDTADFAEDGQSYAQVLQGLLAAAKPILDFSEAATEAAAGGEEGSIDYAEGTAPESIALDQKIRAYMKDHKVDYATAFGLVQP